MTSHFTPKEALDLSFHEAQLYVINSKKMVNNDKILVDLMIYK